MKLSISIAFPHQSLVWNQIPVTPSRRRDARSGASGPQRVANRRVAVIAPEQIAIGIVAVGGVLAAGEDGDDGPHRMGASREGAVPDL